MFVPRFVVKAISFACVQALCSIAIAQTNAPTASPTTLQTAVERAVLQNPEVKLRFHNLEAVKYERAAATGNWLPRIDLEAGVGPKQILTPSLASAQNYSSSRAQIQLSQMLFDGFATSSDISRLSHTQQTAYFDFLSVSNQTALEAARAYIDVVRFRQLVELAAANYTTHQEVHDRINQKVTAGVGRRVDLEQAAGRMALAESNWLTEVSNLHDVSARYQRLVGSVPAESLASLGAFDKLVPSAKDFMAQAVRKNPDFLGTVSQIRAYRADLALRKSAMYPTVQLRARQSYETNQSGINGDYRDSAIELVLNYNLFRGGSDTNRAKQYAAKLGSAFDLRDKTCRDVWQTGQIAYNDSVRLQSQIKLLSQHELATGKARQAYQQQFDIGQRSLLDLLDTENELYQARRALANAEFDLTLSQVRVLAATGSLLPSLKLQPMAADRPEAGDSAEDGDEALLCSQQVQTEMVLDRAFDSRLANLPSESKRPKPVEAPTPEALCKAELPKVVETWIGAWNRKDLVTYLSTYDAAFVPAKGMKRAAWEQLRKQRINKKGDIKAVISEIKPIACEAKLAEVSFNQVYDSPDYKDYVEKTLSLVRVDQAWKIVKETVTKGRTF
ncbi:MAG: channel protein TolC [Burkholderiales bacterium PBB3]|nr:MAG: channel protein TolC [Burkholderiales bacterium PBB3]